MPGALRTRSLEDHVTPHSRKQYSYDDLDLVCCHAGVGGSGSPSGRRRRERCASMPECCRYHPGFESCPGEDRNKRRRTLSGTFKGTSASYEANIQVVTKGYTFVKVRKSVADEDSPNCSEPISNHFLYESFDEIHKKDDKITTKAMTTSSGSSSTNAAEEQAKNLDSSTETETKDAYKDNAKVNIDVTTELTGKPRTSSESKVEGNIESSMLHHQQVMRTGVEVTVGDKFDPHVCSDVISDTDLTTETKQSEESQTPKNNVLNSNIPNDQVVTNEEVLQAHNLNASTELEFSSCEFRSTCNPDTYRDCYAKLDTIPEVSFTESGEEVLAAVLENMPGFHITTTLVGLKGAGNNKGSSVELELQKDTPEAGFLGRVLPECDSSIESSMETADHVTILQTSQNVDEVERDPKPQEVPVRLRTQKVRYSDFSARDNEL